MVAKKIEEIANEIVEVAADIVEPTTGDSYNAEYIKEKNQLKSDIIILEKTIFQLINKLDNVDQSLAGLKHRIKVLETRVGVIH